MKMAITVNVVKFVFRFLRGRCTIDNCLFSHAVPADKMPVCLFYLRGKCTKQNCPYSHVKVNSNAQICQKFIKGLCTLGSKVRIT